METRNHTTGNLRQALAFHRWGLRLVPMHGKTPLVKAWPSLHLGEQDVRNWCERGVNWAAITGEPLIVVDSDSEAAEAKIAALGIASSVEVITGRGGRHRYFLSAADTIVRCKNGVHGVAGFDVKGWHGLAVLPGSVHADTGRRYEFVPGKELRSLADLPVFDPQWIAEPAPPLSEVRGPAMPTAIKNVRAYIRGIQSIEGCNGSNACYRVAALLFEHGYSQAEALAEMLDWNETNAFPPWSQPELVHKIASVWKRKLERTGMHGGRA